MATDLPVINKPPFGSPCNGCGVCCALELCDVAEEYLPGSSPPCPALEWKGDRFWCGLVTRPSYHLRMNFNGDALLAPLFLQAIAAGQGCGCPDEEGA